MFTVTADAPQSPVSTGELSAFIGLGDLSPTDPQVSLLGAFLASATATAEKCLGLAIDPRPHVYDGDPVYIGTVSNGIIPGRFLRGPVDLPYANLISVDGVDIYDPDERTLTTDEYRVERTKVYVHGTYQRIVITYTAGWEDVPSPVQMAIMMMAAYLYEHRGACDMEDALTQSGAAGVLRPYKRHYAA